MNGICRGKCGVIYKTSSGWMMMMDYPNKKEKRKKEKVKWISFMYLSPLWTQSSNQATQASLNGPLAIDIEYPPQAGLLV